MRKLGLLDIKKKRLRGYLTAVFHCEKEDYREKAGPDSSQRHTVNRQEATSTSYSIGHPTRYKANYFTVRVVKSSLPTLPLEIFKI